MTESEGEREREREREGTGRRGAEIWLSTTRSFSLTSEKAKVQAKYEL